MTLYSYVVLRDFGFAPNPFFGYCTLATCKPQIRATAKPGDWVFGTGSKQRGLEGALVYGMRVDEVLSFDEYWSDARFQAKRPSLSGSLVKLYGDNIYCRDANGNWKQADSHHSLAGGVLNLDNLRRDTSTDKVLVSRHFVYFGDAAPKIPQALRSFDGGDIVKVGPGHRADLTPAHMEAAIRWIESLEEFGCCAGDPQDWVSARKLR